MNCRTHRKGTILIVALGLLAALAIIGATVISLSRIDRFSSQKFRQAAEMDLAVEAGLTWLEAEIVNNYWDNNFWAQAAGNSYTRKAGLLDKPQTPDAHSRIAIVRPDTNGIITAARTAFDPGMYRSSGGDSTGDWYSLPVMKNLPDPGKMDNIKHNVPDAWNASKDVSELKFRASGNRTIEIALTMVDLCGRYNLNFHGDSQYDATNGGQSYDDTGFLLTDVAPDYRIYSGGSNGRTALSQPDRQNYSKVVYLNQGGLRGRWNNSSGPATNADRTLNFFNPGNDLPYLADDLVELLLLRGTGGANRRTRLERILQPTLNRGGEEPSGADDTMFYKALYTTHSWVSAARPRRTNESRLSEDLYVKADLDAATQDQLKEALLATGVFDDTPAGKKKLNQILANIIDFRDKDHKPTAIEYVSGGYVYGVDRQPFLSEVYFEKIPPADPQDPPDYTDYRVTVELCNPYDTKLEDGKAYTKVTCGKGGHVTAGLEPNEVPARPETGTPVGIAVGSKIVRVPNSENPLDYLEPVLLFTESEGDVTKEILIDRITFDALPAVAGESWQRTNRSGKDRAGANANFFGGWTAKQVQGEQTCTGGAGSFNATSPTKVCKPIENRSLTEEPDSREKRRYKPDDLSFRSLGDLVRVLQIGPVVGPNQGADDDKPVTEILAEEPVEDCYLNLLDDKLKRLIEVFTVNSPYCDGIDNDGDEDVDGNDTGFQTISGGVPTDVLGPEIYQHGRINLLTAPPEVIRGLLPLQLKRRGYKPWDVARWICQYREQNLRNSPVDILNINYGSYKGYDLFTRNDNTDDDGNGAPDDFAERFYLWTYMSNWATIRSDCFAVYGVARIKSAAGRTEGMRRFLTVLDRVPATAYPPFVWVSDSDHDLRPNPRFIPVRRVFTTGID